MLDLWVYPSAFQAVLREFSGVGEMVEVGFA